MNRRPSQLERTGFYVERWLDGDRQALGTLWKRFTPLVLSRIRHHSSWSSVQNLSVEDAAQEVWTKILAAPENAFTPAGEGSFVAWLGKVTDSTVTDLVRRGTALKRGAGARAEVLDTRAKGMVCNMPGQNQELGPAASARVAEFEAIAGEVLGERERLAWTWVAILGLTTEEAAFGLGTTSGAVRNLLRRSRVKLADKLGGSGVTSFGQARGKD